MPVFGLAIGGAFGALFGVMEKIGIDKGFQQEVRDILQPGTSALFLVVRKVTPDRVTEALSKYGGRVLKSSLSKDAEEQLQRALRGGVQDPATTTGEPATAGVNRDGPAAVTGLPS